jgi:hypothetical protein
MKTLFPILTLFLSLCISTSDLFAQSRYKATAQGTILVDAYYGAPNFFSWGFDLIADKAVKAAYDNELSDFAKIDYTSSNLNPVGLRASYMVTEWIGIGGEISYNQNSVSFQVQDTFTNQLYFYKLSTSGLSIVPSVDLHFLQNSRDWDVYLGFALGYTLRPFSLSSDNPYISKVTVASPIPIAFRLNIGARYFITENIGLNLSIGAPLGGLINAGISAKF